MGNAQRRYPIAILRPDGFILARILRMQESRDRRRFLRALVASLFAALAETAGVVALYPFIAAAADPAAAIQSETLGLLASTFGVEDPTDLVLLLGLGALLALALTIGARTLGAYALMRYVQRQSAALSAALLGRWLGGSYERLAGRRPADLSARILAEVEEVASGVILNVMRLIAFGAVALCLTGVLVALDPVAALSLGGALGLAYAGVYALLRGRLRQLGARRMREIQTVHRALLATIGSAKDIKLQGLEDRFLARFIDPLVASARLRTRFTLLQETPRGALEMLTFAFMIVLAMWTLARREGDLAEAAPLLGVYALAGARLLPLAQKIFKAASELRAALPALDAIEAELATPARAITGARKIGDTARLALHDAISLKGVTYAPSGAARPILRDVSLTIPVGRATAFTGPTGAGKSTAADILLGLLRPQAGRLVLDGAPIDEDRLPAWMRSIGHVPQSVHLIDDTVAANIAFGATSGEVDPAALHRAAARACILEVIEAMPLGFDTPVGEGGLRLSGGQRQRLGLARALYRDPPILILDEATSSLDAETEARLLDALLLPEDKTVVLIAHRPAAIARCRRVIRFEAGRVVSVVDEGAPTPCVEAAPS